MKSSILHLLSLFLILSFSAACGKKSDGGGNNPNPIPNVNEYILPNGTGTVGTAGHDALVNWLNVADTSSGMRAFYVAKSGSMQFWSETQLCQMVGINLPLCTKPTKCLISNGLAVELGTTQFDNLRPKGCTLSGVFYNKANDTALREAVLGKSGRFVMKDKTVQAGNLFTVYYSLYEGDTKISGAAQINTSLPAALNPVILEENLQRTKILFTAY
jgi:hypothetical protein